MAFLPGLTNLFKTGRHARRRARTAANAEAAQSQVEREDYDRKKKSERKRAQQLKIRGLRSKRSASYFSSNAEGRRETVG